jgi:hypothetical protein
MRKTIGLPFNGNGGSISKKHGNITINMQKEKKGGFMWVLENQ